MTDAQFQRGFELRDQIKVVYMGLKIIKDSTEIAFWSNEENCYVKLRLASGHNLNPRESIPPLVWNERLYIDTRNSVIAEYTAQLKKLQDEFDAL